MKAITILQKCIPPPYIDIIQGSSTLMECLQILEKLCAREVLKYKISHKPNNSHRQNNRMQRQEDSNRNLPSDQNSEEERNDKKISTTHQLSQFQWDGERITLRFYIQKWYNLLEGSKSKKALKVLQQLVPPTYRDIL